MVKTTGLTDTKGYLYTASGGQIASDDNSGLDTNFKMTKRVRAGTYYVRVKHRNTSSVGNYMLVSQFIPNDHGNSRNTATPINPNSITHGRIERARDSDYFKIVIPRGGGTLVVKTTGLTDTKGYLYTAGGGQIASDDNSGLDTNFKMTKRVRAGTYYVRVKHRNTSSVGNYMLVSQFTPNDHGNSRNTATPINPNSITHGRIERARDSDYFKIVIPRGGGTLRGTVVSCSPRKNLFFPSRKPKSTLLWR